MAAIQQLFGIKDTVENYRQYDILRTINPDIFCDHGQINWSMVGALKPFGSIGTSDNENRIDFCDFAKEVTGDYLVNTAQLVGDCHLPSARVRMSDGSEKCITDVKVGDYVITHNGRSRMVLNFIEKPYKGDIVKVKCKGYDSYMESTPDHKYLTYPKIWDWSYAQAATRKKYRSEEQEWKAIGDFKVKDYVLQPRTHEEESKLYIFDLSNIEDSVILGDQVRLGNRGKTCNREIVLDEKLGWLIGIYLAEGGLDKDKDGNATRITFNLNITEVIYAEQIRQYIKDIFNTDCTIGSVPSKPNVLYARVCNSLVSRFFQKIIPENIYNKEVPSCIFNSFKNVRLACLRGWMDGDGSLQTSKSKKWTKRFSKMCYGCRFSK